MLGTGTPKNRDEVNNLEVCERDGRVCDFEVIGESSIFLHVSGDTCGVMKDEKVKLRDLHVSYTLCYSTYNVGDLNS